MWDVGGDSFDSLVVLTFLKWPTYPLITWIASCDFWFGCSGAWCRGWQWAKWGVASCCCMNCKPEYLLLFSYIWDYFIWDLQTCCYVIIVYLSSYLRRFYCY
jgi:hypothetical protein